MSGILHDRQIRRASMEVAANSRQIIFDLHFRKGNQQEGYNVVWGGEPPLARHPDEEIVMSTPITQREPLHWEQLDPEDFDSEFMRTMAQEITETDRVFLNPDLDAELPTTVEPTDTVQQTVTEILGDVDGRLSEDRAIEKLNKEDLVCAQAQIQANAKASANTAARSRHKQISCRLSTRKRWTR